MAAVERVEHRHVVAARDELLGDDRPDVAGSAGDEQAHGAARIGPCSPPLAAAAIAGCPVFPASSPWNQRVDRCRVHPRSDAMVARSAPSETVHPDFGSGRYDGRPIGIPFQVVVAQPRSARGSRFEYADESDPGPYPIPRQPADRGRRRPPHARRPARHLPPLRAVRGRAQRRRAGAPTAARSSTCARTGCAPRAGRPPTPPACRSCPGLARYDEVARGRDPARAALHGRAHPPRVRLARPPLRVRR